MTGVQTCALPIWAAAVQGEQPLLGNGSGRFALPDEVLTFNTASESERALLAYTLVQHSPKISDCDKGAFKVSYREGIWKLG